MSTPSRHLMPSSLLHLPTLLIYKTFIDPVDRITGKYHKMGSSSCSGGEDYRCRDRDAALELKLVAIAAILVGSFIGVCIPIAGKSRTYLKSNSNFFLIVKSFAAGVILATGFVHVLPDAFESLTNGCLAENPWSKFPFAGFVAMMAALITLFVDVAATDYYQQSSDGASSASAIEEMAVEEACHGHNHLHEHLLGHDPTNLMIRQRVVAQVLEVGIVAHSVIIGVSLGASESPCTIRPLVAALTFHQFFEGMGLGGCIAQASFRSRASAAMAVLFSLTTPLGVALGIGISQRYDENSPTALVVEGILNSASAGILIYMALVDLIGADFISSKIQSLYSPAMKAWAFVALVLGANCMSLLAYWA